MTIVKRGALVLFGLVCSVALSRGEPIRIQLTDTAKLKSVSLDTARREVETIFTRAGLPILFSEASHGCLARVYVLERIPGRVRVSHRVLGRGDPLAVLLQDRSSRPVPVIYVSRSAVTAQATGAPGARLEALLLGRALGRVIAHELAHVLLEFEHTPSGILKPDFDQSDLVRADSAHLGFTADQVRRLAGLARAYHTKTAALAGDGSKD